MEVYIKMGFSYDYSILIKELKTEIADGVLTPKSFIQVLREEKPVFELYRPIINWYYDDKRTKESLAPNILDSDDEIREKKFLEFLYNRDKKSLEQITVEKCLYELEQMNSLI